MLYYLTTAFEGWLGDSVYWVIQIFTQFHFRAFAALIFSFLFVILLGPHTIARLRALKVGDNPEFYNSDLNTLNQGKKDTPTMGGLLICAAILVSVLLFADVVHSRYVHISIFTLLWFAGVGLFDDWLKLTASSRDLTLLLLVPYVPGSAELIVVSGAMAGSCLGFLWFNCNPARVFMGDTGSLALGGLLAFVAVAIRQEALLILIAGIFYIELASIVLQISYFKLSHGKRIFRCAPIHHHFHLGGWSESQVVVRFWLVTAILGAIALASIKVR